MRYDGGDSNTENLTLSDCPCQYDHALGNLTWLRQWHEDDPVDDAELQRNNLTCALYQARALAPTNHHHIWRYAHDITHHKYPTLGVWHTRRSRCLARRP